MARLDVYRLADAVKGGLVIDVQSNLLDHFTTRIVVPLLPLIARSVPVRDLNPIFEIDGATYVFMAQAMASIRLRELGRPVFSLDRQHDLITRALDVLLIGL